MNKLIRVKDEIKFPPPPLFSNTYSNRENESNDKFRTDNWHWLWNNDKIVKRITLGWLP